MSGPAGVWYGIGFNASEMKDAPWAVIVDGRLDAEGDGFDWLGDLRITCPDTAPHSTAALYRRREE